MFRIYDNILYFSTIKNISIREIEFRAGLSSGSIRRWNDSDPGISKVNLVARVLNVTINDLLYGVQNINFIENKYYMININGALINMTPPSGDEISLLLKRYDLISFNYNVSSRLLDSSLGFSDTLFMFNSINMNYQFIVYNSYFNRNIFDNRLNNKIVLLKDNLKNIYLIGKLLFVQEIVYPIFIPLDSYKSHFTIDVDNYSVISECVNIIQRV